VTRPQRPCLGCDRLIASGSRCRACKPRNGSTRRWRKRRHQVLVRDNFTCYHCGGRATDVHHLVPVRDGGTDHPSILVAACTAHRGDR
jgi:5-methylcytosine-specific restriction endonuclease McrA